MKMFMMVQPSEDGARLTFYPSEAEFLGAVKEHQEGCESDTVRTLTAEEAAGDSMYWPEGSIFAAEVTPLRLQPAEVITSWKLTT